MVKILEKCLLSNWDFRKVVDKRSCNFAKNEFSHLSFLKISNIATPGNIATRMYSIVEWGGQDLKGEFIQQLGNTKNLDFCSPLTQVYTL